MIAYTFPVMTRPLRTIYGFGTRLSDFVAQAPNAGVAKFGDIHQ
jgi:hypothetical protein